MLCYSLQKNSLKVNEVKSKVMVLGGEEGLVCEVSMDRKQLEYVSKFKSTWCLCFCHRRRDGVE